MSRIEVMAHAPEGFDENALMLPVRGTSDTETYRFALYFVRGAAGDELEESLEGDVYTVGGPTLPARAALVGKLFEFVQDQVDDDMSGMTEKAIQATWDSYYSAAKLILDGSIKAEPDFGVEIAFETATGGGGTEIWAYKIYRVA